MANHPFVKAAETPMTPCELLAAAQAQLALLMTGKGVRSVETPQLGKVEFHATSISDLGRMIESLKAECAASLGLEPTGRRGPISIEAWP